ncbi:hypothetical protein RFI_36476 [Reticulomyxa filosa]|uniref:Uncharacterized protein n=1 Tax=Reticulomyxa filosa TaxID=46433 RepID=X6LG66_RETFI|nr:hypothetical protein RFI_36476 [Reticulomyxa filosa]|eukprot:ETO00963.1 hypothetical protein RFI_36476 [Reticulomyxa filosa]
MQVWANWKRSPVSSTFKVSDKVKLTREKIGDEVIDLDWSMDTLGYEGKVNGVGVSNDDDWIDPETKISKMANVLNWIIVVNMSRSGQCNIERFEGGPVRKETSRRKKRISRLRKYLQDIGNYEKRLVNKE